MIFALRSGGRQFAAKVSCLIAFWCPVLSIAGEIALTFDDAPRPGSAMMSGEDKTDKIIQALQRAEVEHATFFVTTDKIVDQAAQNRLKKYTDAGFTLANHSHTHKSANKVAPQEFLLDFYQSHLVLKDHPNYLKLHRFPFLHYGSDTQTRAELLNGLTELGYAIGYVTVDNYDWYLNSKVVEAHDAGKKINYEKLKQLYLETLWQGIQFYDQIAQKELGRSPKHVLLLHENELAALFIGDLVELIEAKGWKIISAQEAYSDPIADQYDPAFEFNNQGRISAIAENKGRARKQLIHVSEDTDYLDAKLKEYQIFDH